MKMALISWCNLSYSELNLKDLHWNNFFGKQKTKQHMFLFFYGWFELLTTIVSHDILDPNYLNIIVQQKSVCHEFQIKY